MQHLVAATEVVRINRRGVVLKVDPVSDDHRRRHDQFKNLSVPVVRPDVIMKKNSRGKIEATRSCAWRHDECGVIGQSPLRSGLRPVARAASELLQQCRGLLREIALSESCGAFRARLVACFHESALQTSNIQCVTSRNEFRIE